MQKLTNTWNGHVVGTIIRANTVKTNMGTYHVTDADMTWLYKQQSKRTFCEADIRVVGQLIWAEEHEEA